MNTCILCGGLEASNEDALPTWELEMLKRTSEGPFVSVRDRVMTPKTKTPRRFITRRPCQKCNQWMGNTFEDRAAPLLKPMMEDDQETTLTPNQQAIIACWIVKTTMMLRLTDTTRRPYPAEEYRQLRHGNRTVGHFVERVDWCADVQEDDGMTQAIGHLVMQVLYKRGREDRALQNGQNSSALSAAFGRYPSNPLSGPLVRSHC